MKLLVTVLLLVGALAGCTDNSTTPPPSATTTNASRVVPAVSNPLDATKFLSDPCALLTEQQAVDLGLPVAEKDNTACTWRKDRNNPTPLEVLRIGLLKDYGLAKIFEGCRIGCDTWAVTEIAGYPAIHANGPLESKYGMCRLYVGIADSSSILLTDGDLEAMQKGATDGTSGGPKCDRADRAATLVVQKVKGGQ